MPRPRVTRLVVLAATVVAAAGLLVWLLRAQPLPAGASRVERVFHEHCADCHGRDGRGSWRSLVFMVNPGDLTDRARMDGQADQYLFDIIKHGGSPIGRPGMPAYGYHLSDEEIRELVGYLRRIRGSARS